MGTQLPNPFVAVAPARRPGLRRLAAALAHDIGKYVARTAHNLPTSPGVRVEPAVQAMLLRDLYPPEGEPTHAARFAELSVPLRAELADDRPAQVAELLAAIAALEPAVRSGDSDALQRAAGHAREVDRLLRSLSRHAHEVRP